MAWNKKHVAYLKENLGIKTHKEIAAAIGKSHWSVSRYVSNHELSNQKYAPQKKYVCEHTESDRELARLLAKYICFGLKRGAQPFNAVEGAMTAIRYSAGGETK